MGIFIGAASLACLTVPVAIKSKRRFEECLPIATMAAILVLFLFGVLNILKIAVPCMIGLSIVSVAYSIYLSWSRKDCSAQCYVFTPGFFLFLLFVLVMPLLCKSLRIYTWDEYSHWGLAAKDMFCFDAMAYRQDTHVQMNTYPPFITLFQYYFLKCTGTYSEPAIYAAQNLMGIIFLLPLAKRITWKNWAALFPLAVVIACVPIYLFPNYWFEAYVDCLLGIGVAYSIVTYFCSEKKDLFAACSSSMGIGFVILLKNTGVIFAVIPVCMILADYLFVQRKAVREKGIKIGKKIVCVLLCLLLAFGAKGIFEIALTANGRVSAERKVITKLVRKVLPQSAEIISEDGMVVYKEDPDPASKVVSIDFAVPLKEEEGHIGGLLNDYQFDGLEAFIRFWHYDVTLRFGSFSPTYWELYLFLVGIGLLLLWLFRNEQDIRSLRICIVGLLVGFWIYAVISMVGILFSFSPRQASKLMGFDRYIKSFYLTILLVWLSLFLQRVKEKNFFMTVFAALCFSLFAISPRDVLYQAAGHIPGYDTSFDQTPVVETLSDLDADTTKVAFVSQQDTGYDLVCTRYYLLPVRVQACLGWNFIENPADVNDLSVATTAEKWADALKKQGFTHVYIYQTDAYFCGAFSKMFQNADEIQDQTLFEIREKDGGIVLYRCG